MSFPFPLYIFFSFNSKLSREFYVICSYFCEHGLNLGEFGTAKFKMRKINVIIFAWQNFDKLCSYLFIFIKFLCFYYVGIQN